MFKELVYHSRTRRRFYGDYHIDKKDLEYLIDLARMTPSSFNLQPLKYFISHQDDTNKLIFPYLKWASYLKDWECPALDERPSAYIVILRDNNISKINTCDHGIAAQTIMLGTVEKELGGCIHSAIDKEGLAKDLNISNNYEILLVLSIGKPKEDVLVEPVVDENIKYWRDSEGKHHVPKRSLNEIMLDKL